MWPFSRWTRDHAARLEFVLVAERGVLERQALLLCESIRRFAGRYAQSSIVVASPRPDRRPGALTLARLAELNCTYLPMDVVSVEPEYGTTFRMYVSAEVERISKADVLVAMDSDMVFACEPDLALQGAAAAFRPVDFQGMCSTGVEDPRDAYWQALCHVVGVDYGAIPMVRTTIGDLSVKASYNGGLAVVRRECGIFARTLRFFETSIAAGLAPSPGTSVRVNAGHGQVSGRGSELWGSSQACLSLAVWGSGLKARTLPPSHNVPLHAFHLFSAGQQEMALSLVHYHDLFEGDPALNPLLNGAANVPPHFVDWLRAMTSNRHENAPALADGGA